MYFDKLNDKQENQVIEEGKTPPATPNPNEQQPGKEPGEGEEGEKTPATTDSQNENGEQNGGNPPATTDANAGNPSATPVTPEVPQNILDKLKEKGFNSVEELLEHATKQNVEETPEQKAKKEETKKVDFIKYAVDKGITLDEIKQAEELSKKELIPLVFDDFAIDYLDENPDDDLDDAKFAFNTRYGITDEENISATSKKMLEAQKRQILSEKLSKYNELNTEYNDFLEIQSKEPLFNKLLIDTLKVDELIELGNNNGKTNFKKSISEKEIMDSINETFGKDFLINAFSNFANGQQDQVAESLKKVAKLVHTSMIFNEAIEAHGEQMKALGLKEGALGAKSSFNKNEHIPGANDFGKEDLSTLQNAYS